MEKIYELIVNTLFSCRIGYYVVILLRLNYATYD